MRRVGEQDRCRPRIAIVLAAGEVDAEACRGLGDTRRDDLLVDGERGVQGAGLVDRDDGEDAHGEADEAELHALGRREDVDAVPARAVVRRPGKDKLAAAARRVAEGGHELVRRSGRGAGDDRAADGVRTHGDQVRPCLAVVAAGA